MSQKIDALTKKYVSQNHIFADIVNYYIFDGEQKVKSEDLTTMNSVETAIIEDRLGRLTGKERIRDILKSVVIREYGEVIYILVGVENQTDLHYAMPVRNLLYDAINYAAQVAETANAKRSNIRKAELLEDKRRTRIPRAEFLSGFGKDDKVVPVITITFYWGDKPWDAPRKLSDMFKPDKLTYKKYINDYELNLIIPSEIEDAGKFKTELNLVVKALAMRNDKEGFKKLMIQKEYSSIDEQTADVICELTAMRRIKAEGGRVNMCKAVEEIKEEAREQGKKQGEAEGRKQGEYSMIVKMMKNGMSDDMLIKYCGISHDELDKYKKALLAKA